MHKTPKKIFDEIARERPPCERAAAFNDHVCSGRSTMEHAWTYGGRQINEKWAIVRLCWWVHLGPGLDKQKNRYLSLRHATTEDLAKYPRVEWGKIKSLFEKKYGKDVR